MSENKKSKPVPAPSESISTGEMPKQSRKKIQIQYRPFPAPPPANQKIHPRQKLPLVPEGEEVPDETPSPPIEHDEK